MALTGIIIGIVFWIMGILIFISEYSENKRCTEKASAVIVDVIKEERWRYRKHGSRYVTHYYPILEFPVRDKIYRVKTVIKATLPDTYKQGNRLDILYNPQNPADLKLQKNTVWEGVAGMILMFVFGTIFAYIAIRAGG